MIAASSERDEHGERYDHDERGGRGRGEAVTIVDLGLGNLRSVEKSVERAAGAAGLGAPTITRDPDVVGRARLLVVPGQGAFRDGAAALDAGGGAMRGAIAAALDGGAAYLGICLGLQLLFDGSDEAPEARGLSRFAGRVVRIPDGLTDGQCPSCAPGAPTTGRRLKVPHMGWNQPVLLRTDGGARLAPLIAPRPGEGDPPWFYFVHGYHAVADDPSIVAATAGYGCLELTAAIARGPLVATQFHPEKSQRAGLALLEAFFARASAGVPAEARP